MTNIQQNVGNSICTLSNLHLVVERKKFSLLNCDSVSPTRNLGTVMSDGRVLPEGPRKKVDEKTNTFGRFKQNFSTLCCFVSISYIIGQIADQRRVIMITDSVIPLQKNQIQAAAEVLSKAFYDDPLFVYFFPDPSDRIRKSTGYFQLLARYGLLYGEIETTSLNLEGVAIWLPSHKKHKSLISLLRSGMISFMIGGGMSAVIRMIRLDRYPEIVNNLHAPFPHWYLQAIGVEPSLQSNGYASILLRNKLARFDREGSVCYLETQNKENIPMYIHYGFELVEEYRLPKTSFLNWAMLRKPRY